MRSTPNRPPVPVPAPNVHKDGQATPLAVTIDYASGRYPTELSLSRRCSTCFMLTHPPNTRHPHSHTPAGAPTADEGMAVSLALFIIVQVSVVIGALLPLGL